MAVYPTYLTGQRLTADLLTSGQTLFVRKAADESVTASVTLQDDDELFLSVAANASYFVEAWIRYTGANNTPDLRINYSYPASATFSRSDWGAPSTSTTSADTIDTTLQTTGDNGRGAGTSERSLYVKGDLVVSSTSGTFKVRWAQVTSDAGAVTVKAGSRLQLVRYA